MELDTKLYDFLATYTSKEALRSVETYGDQGFEAWRQLKARYAPEGDRMELRRLQSLFVRK